ncbi:MAG: helix-hairpin-helix domain-containing protein [Firmicutes bacterium]|nr:helix-hairpin-helix domain-containing protein [Bacillota bacterium]
MKTKISLRVVIIMTIIILPLILAVSGFQGKGESIKLRFLELIGAEESLADSDENPFIQSGTNGMDTGLQNKNSIIDLAAAQNLENGIHVCETKESLIVIDISGEVQIPGVYMLSEGARVFDAIEAAGGLTKNGDIDIINQAEPLIDGMKIYIPSADETSGLPRGVSSVGKQAVGISYSSLININTASSEELQQIPGIGPSTAEKIIAYRNLHGKFSSVEELINISGIGAKTLEKMKGYIVAR